VVGGLVGRHVSVRRCQKCLLRLRRLIAVSIRLDRSRPIEHHSATVGEPNWQSWTEDRQKEFDARRRWIEKSINSKLTFRKHALAHIRGTGESSLIKRQGKTFNFRLN
jgi:hypothetical protein